MKQMSMRQKRVAEQLREALAQSIARGGFKSPLIDSLINIPYVWISPDLRNARVYFTTLQDLTDQATKEVSKALNAEAFRFQQDIASFARKNTPKIKFYADVEGERTNKIEEIFSAITTTEARI
ncbi:MAG: ribosome-binding factor A [Alphaproteobacteria bacterium]|jgi:ribosome-binding factor A